MAAIADITIKWSGKEYVISGLLDSQTVLDLKEEIKKHTNVLPVRQKLLGLKAKGIFWLCSVLSLTGMVLCNSAVTVMQPQIFGSTSAEWYCFKTKLSPQIERVVCFECQ